MAASTGKILVLSNDPQSAQEIATPLLETGLDVVVACKTGEAIISLREGTVALLVVDARLKETPAKAFLSKAWQFVPQTMRAVFEPEWMDLNLREMINESAPCAVFTGTLDVARVRSLLERNAKMAALSESPLPRPRTPERESPPVKTLPGVFAASAERREAASRALFQEKKTAQESTPPPQIEPEKPAAAKNLPVEYKLNLNAPDLAAEVGRILDLLFDNPDIRLPVLPQVGMEVQKLISQQNSTFEQIAGKVGLDQSMSARILEVANSPLYAGIEQIRNLQHAVSRIGLLETRNILQVVAAENLFKTKDRKIATLMAMLWMHSLACAYGNEILARALSIAESQDFFTMGLLHDIGKLLIIHLIQEGYDKGIWTKETITLELISRLFRERHTAMGLRLVQRWGYPESFHTVVSQHNNDASIHEFDEPAVVTYFSNLLTRKMGLSLEPHSEALLERHEIAQALNMSAPVRERIEKTMATTVEKIKASFIR